jgi:hypothetical protein
MTSKLHRDHVAEAAVVASGTGLTAAIRGLDGLAGCKIRGRHHGGVSAR